MPTVCVNRRTALSEFHQPSSPSSWLMPLKTQSQIIWRLFGKRRASCSAAQEGRIKMQSTEAPIGGEQRLDVHVLEKETREMEEVLSRHLPMFYRRAYRYLGNAANAEDAVQDALLSACKHLDQFKGQAKMSTWLTSIVINSARTQLRRRPDQPHLSLDEHLGA